MVEPVTPVYNPFGITAPCEGYVPGFGDRDADFHLIRDRPETAVIDSEWPATKRSIPEPLRSVLQAVGLLHGNQPTNLFFSYRLPCTEERGETARNAHQLKAIFDAELRAVTAHVLIPVGEPAIHTVLEQYSLVDPDSVALDSLHATELASGSWIILPLAEPSKWSSADETAARNALEALLSRDYRREADLGRHIPGSDSYFVR